MEAIRSFGRLKRIVRTGWLMAGLEKAQIESVADHTARTAFITMLICDSMKSTEVDEGKALKMAIIHDLPEAILMDFDKVSSEVVGKEKRSTLELMALKKILSSLPAHNRREYERCFREYLEGSSREAQIVRVADRAEAYLQAAEYEEMGFPNRLGSKMKEELRRLINKYGFRRLAVVAGIGR